MWELPQLGHVRRVALEKTYLIVIHLSLAGGDSLAQTPCGVICHIFLE